MGMTGILISLKILNCSNSFCQVFSLIIELHYCRLISMLINQLVGEYIGNIQQHISLKKSY